MAAPAISSSPHQQEFVRPPKSSRRNVTPPNGNNSSVTESANNLYNQAPDLGISKSISNAYENAPNLGIQSTFYRVLGYDDLSGEGEEQKQPSSSTSNRQEGESLEREDEVLDAHEISKQKGPSSKDRIGKSQMEIGTEIGIPTRAGSGTTVSPDKTNRLALKKSHSSEKTKPRQAKVPEDYAPLPCPEKNAGTGKCDEIQDKLATQLGIQNSTSGKKDSPSNSPRQRQSSNNGGGTGSKTPTSTTSSNEHKRRSFGLKMRDQIKGELKILSGSLTNNEDKIIQGLNIKHGET